MRVIATLVFAGAMLTSLRPVAAQRGPAPTPMRGASPAALLLGARADLGLTDEQVGRLERLATAQNATLTGSPGDVLRARADLADAMKGEGDAAALKRAMDRLHQLRSDRALARLKARQDARAILTADQRAKADAMRNAMRRGGGMRGGMRGMRGMRGGRGGAMGPGRWGSRGGDMPMPPAGERRQGPPPRPPVDESQP